MPVKDPELIIKQCLECHATFTPTKGKPSARRKRKFCSTQCAAVFNGRLGSVATQALRTNNDPEFMRKTEAQYAAVSAFMTNNNPMKRTEVAAQMSKTRTARLQNDSALREKIAENTRQAWVDGKFDGVATGLCQWYDHTKPNGTTIKLQGTWEVATARRFDELGIQYDTHKGRIAYIDAHGNERSYYPDFYVAEPWNAYVDVKGAFWNDEQEEKIELIRKSNPGMNLIIATGPILKEWGVKIKATQMELLSGKKPIKPDPQ